MKKTGSRYRKILSKQVAPKSIMQRSDCAIVAIRCEVEHVNFSESIHTLLLMGHNTAQCVWAEAVLRGEGAKSGHALTPVRDTAPCLLPPPKKKC